MRELGFIAGLQKGSLEYPPTTQSHDRQAPYNMPVWTSEDTAKLFLLVLFVGTFVVVLKSLYGAERRLNSKEAARAAAAGKDQ